MIPKANILTLAVLFIAGQLSLTQAACAATHAIFDLSRPAGAPFPSNAFTVVAPENITGLRVNLPLPDCEPEADGYGQIGLYVGGTAEVHIKDFMYKDILNHIWAPEEVGKNLRAVRVDPHYYSWSVAVADFNHDGVMDVAKRRKQSIDNPPGLLRSEVRDPRGP